MKKDSCSIPDSKSPEYAVYVRDILSKHKVVAVVGYSKNADRPAHHCITFLRERGFRAYPVNPTIESTEEHGKVYPDLASLPERAEIVDVFRRPDTVMPVVEEAIAAKADVVWLQDGVVNEEAAARARNAGLKVVMDDCTMRQAGRLNIRHD
jgi:predicted CoA-binding protein